MRNLFTLLFICTSFIVLAENELAVTSKINSVTVYTQGAQIYRDAKAEIPVGKTMLVFKDISTNVDKESIQVKGEGAFTIMSVAYKFDYLTIQSVADEIVALQKKQTEINSQITYENSILNVFKAEQTLIERNQSIGGANTGVTAENLKAMADFQRARLTEIFTKQIEIANKISTLNSEVQKISAQLKELNINITQAKGEIHVLVSSKTALTGNFSLNYYVQNAGWYANYDLRVDKINQPIEINYKANVFQNTGEDWKNVKLSLNNGNPNESGVMPKIYPWRLHYGAITSGIYQPSSYINKNFYAVQGRVTDANGEPLIGATVMVKGGTLGTITDINGNYSLQLSNGSNYLLFNYIGFNTVEMPITNSVLNVVMLESAQYLEEVVVAAGIKSVDIRNVELFSGRSNNEKAEMKTLALETNFQYKATTFTYEIEEPYTVISDGKISTIDIQAVKVNADYEYFAVPKIDRDAFLTANVTDWRELNLLTGEANIFFEGAFLGKTVLDPTYASDTISISLGRDKSVQIQRNKMKEFTQRQFLGGNKIETVAFEIKVRNNKSEPIHIVIQNQFPISSENDVTVEGSIKPAGNIEDETQIITWDMDIVPGEEKKMELKYTVKYPKDRVIVLE
mgnify:FL=1